MASGRALRLHRIGHWFDPDISHALFYKHADFAFNSQWKVTVQPYRDSYILYIDDVYQRRQGVFISKRYSIKAHKWQKNSSNGVDYWETVRCTVTTDGIHVELKAL